MNRSLPLIMAVVGGILLSVAWPPLPYTPLLFIAWIPLLWVERTLRSHGLFVGLLLLHMLIWNGLTTWWIWYASVPGAVSAITANSLLMCLPWIGYRFIKNKKGTPTGLLALISGWMAFEYIHLQDWGLSWPWLTLGNGLAGQTGWIQWYEYTGASGGTLWVLTVNILLFLQWKQHKNPDTKKILPYRWIALAILAIPIGLSNWIGNRQGDQTDPTMEVAILQPNIDPYEKVSSYTSFDQQLQTLIKQSEDNITEQTALLIWPETALYRVGGIGERELKERGRIYDSLWTFLRRHPNLTLFTGVESYGITDKKSPNSIPAPAWLQPMGRTDSLFIESYNGAALLDSSGSLAFYHKSKLVPGVETLPAFLQILSGWFEEFGGTTGGYTPQSERTVLNTKNSFRLAPAICYESIYGEHLSRYVDKGANLLTIITNDGWWQNTPGHKQHALYAGLRAIENRRWVARSANTGISGFIQPDGRWIDPQPYNTTACIRREIPAPNADRTFYTRFGDILSKLALAFYTGIWIWVLVPLRRKENA